VAAACEAGGKGAAGGAPLHVTREKKKKVAQLRASSAVSSASRTAYLLVLPLRWPPPSPVSSFLRRLAVARRDICCCSMRAECASGTALLRHFGAGGGTRSSQQRPSRKGAVEDDSRKTAGTATVRWRGSCFLLPPLRGALPNLPPASLRAARALSLCLAPAGGALLSPRRTALNPHGVAQPRLARRKMRAARSVPAPAATKKRGVLHVRWALRARSTRLSAGAAAFYLKSAWGRNVTRPLVAWDLPYYLPAGVPWRRTSLRFGGF